MSWYQVIQDKIYKGFRWLVSPFVRFLVKIEMPPSVLSAAGLLLTGLSLVLMYRGWMTAEREGEVTKDALLWMRIAGGVTLFAAAWDTLDGEVARALTRSSAKGAFLDSVLDRVSEFIIYLGLFLFLKLSALDLALLFTLLFTSLAVSYIRARAEGVGIPCKVGLFDRPLRVLTIGVALLAIPAYMNWVIRLLLLGTLGTAIHRFVYALTRRTET